MKSQVNDVGLYKIMWDKMISQGWDNIRRFTEGSGVPFSLETTRRMFSECDYKNISPHTVAVIARHLGFTPAEIRDLLKTYTDDNEYWRLIGEGGTVLSVDHQAAIDIIDAFLASGAEALETLATQVDMVAKVYGIDVDAPLKVMKRRK